MVNRLNVQRRSQIINCLVEGNSIRSTERMTNTHRDTVMRLAVEVGQGCERIMDEKMRGLSSKRIQVDEIWSYVGKHQRFLKPGDDRTQVGDQWTFVALDADTTALATSPSGSWAWEPLASFLAPSMCGKTAIAGMPRAFASFAAAAQPFTDSRLTPGMAATGTSPSPSCTTIDQIRSAGVSTVSRTRRRTQSA